MVGVSPMGGLWESNLMVMNDFFLTGEGLRQGDPLSPLIFNLVVDVLTNMLAKAARDVNGAHKSRLVSSIVHFPQNFFIELLDQ